MDKMSQNLCKLHDDLLVESQRLFDGSIHKTFNVS